LKKRKTAKGERGRAIVRKDGASNRTDNDFTALVY